MNNEQTNTHPLLANAEDDDFKGYGKMRFKKKLPLIIIAVILCVAGLIFFIVTRPVKINLNDYISVSYEGYDGYATATVDFDEDKFIEDYAEKLAGSNEKDQFAMLLIFDSIVDCRLDKDSSLSNGDVITATWYIGQDALAEFEDEYNCKISRDKTTTTVKGLEKVIAVDIFNGVNVEFRGTYPNSDLNITCSDDALISAYYVKADKKSEIRNGEVITLTADVTEELTKKLAKEGKVIESLTKEITVSGIDEYIVDKEDVTDEVLNKIETKAEEEFNKMVSGWKNPDLFISKEHTATYFVVDKLDSSYYYNVNKLFYVYNVKIKNPNNESETIEYIWYISNSDIKKLADGTFEISEKKYSIPYGDTFLGMTSGEAFLVGDYCIVGYEDIDTFYEKCIADDSKNIYEIN